MISTPIVLAFSAGMVAAFNPCGFSLLPAYIGAFVAGDEVAERTDQRIIRAIGVAGAVSVGFILVFASAGLIIGSLTGEARRQLPWITIVIGGLLIAAGVATVAGWKPTIAIRGPRLSTGSNSPRVMVGYGATYAIASLSCTIGPFLAVTGTALSRSPVEGIATYVAYALGMGLIILVLSIASAVAHSTVATHMRRLSRVAPKVGGALMVLAGGYAIWYGRWELAVYNGNLDTDPVIDAIEDLRLWLVAFVENVGALRLAALIIIGVGATIAAARATRTDASPVELTNDA
jgi:cytochrome c-type biogenesis protein